MRNNLNAPQATIIVAAITLIGVMFGHWLAHLREKDKQKKD